MFVLREWRRTSNADATVLANTVFDNNQFETLAIDGTLIRPVTTATSIFEMRLVKTRDRMFNSRTLAKSYLCSFKASSVMLFIERCFVAAHIRQTTS